MSILCRIFRISELVLTDPIDHPDLRRMTTRELADLPFPRGARERHDATIVIEGTVDVTVGERDGVTG